MNILDLTAQGFSLNNARICLQVAADAYGEGQSSDVRIQSAETDTHVLIRDLGNALIIAFRGSASFRNWITDFDAREKLVEFGTRSGRIHAGFDDAWESVAADVVAALSNSPREVVFITGHSLGGALAVVASAELDLSLSCHKIFHSVYTFGQPRVGDAAFAAAQPDWSARLYRITHAADIVPWVPGWLMGYRHFGQQIHFDAMGMHTSFPLTAELAMNGLEIYREFRRGQLAMLADHPVAKYQEAIA